MSLHSDIQSEAYAPPKGAYGITPPSIILRRSTPLTYVSRRTGCETNLRVTLTDDQTFNIVYLSTNENGNPTIMVSNRYGEFMVDSEYLPLPPC